MKKIRLPIKTIKNQFLITMLILTFLPMLIQTNISLKTSREIMENNYIDNYNFNLEASSRNLNLLLEPIISICRNIIGDSGLQGRLSKAKRNQLTNEEIRYIDHILGNAMTQHSYIDSIYIMMEDDNIYYRHKNTDVSGQISNINMEETKQQDWYKQTEKANGREVFICGNIMEPSNNGVNMTDKYITCTKLIRNLEYPYEFQGVLVLNIRRELLNSVFASYQSNAPNKNYIFDTQNQYLFTKDNTELEHIDENLNSIQSYLLDPEQKDEKYIISSAQNKITGWKLYHLGERAWLGEKSNAIGKRSIGIAAAMFVLVAIAFVFISHAINSPIRKLEKVIKKFGQGDTNIQERFNDSEIGEIGKQFIKVVNTNIRLKDDLMMSTVKQREAEVMALQEQINPHFLYNTLDLLYWKAEMSDAKEIADITVSLSNIFKLTLNRGELLIDVAGEINHIKHYLNIQKIRYRERLNTIIDIEPEVYDYKIIKLLIQPIVENAISHGIEPKIGGGTINIKGKTQEDKIIFIIEDDGVGFDDQKDIQGGYGLRNVRERIELYYGQGYGIEVNSEKDKGTCVIICVGKIKEA